MTTTNIEIKTAAKQKGVFYYEIADRLGMIDSALSRKLRRELPAEEKQRIFSLIDEIAAQKQNAARNAANIPNG